MNFGRDRLPVTDPEDPFFKQLRHRFYRLGKWRRDILRDLLQVPVDVKLEKDAEKEFLLQLAREGKLVDLKDAIEEAEKKREEFDRLNQAQSQNEPKENENTGSMRTQD